MNAQCATTSGQGILPLLMSMIGTRLELAAIDVEELAQAMATSFMTVFVAVVLGLIAFAFAGVAVIVFFWDTHRIAAAAGITLCYAMLAALVALRARARWISRPAAFAGTLRELELDGEAFGRRP
jgi:uncharacterized membrane protein YqjE